MKKRIEWLDVARGIAMISIVLGHMGLPHVNKFVFMYHLPIFFLISGYFLSTKGNYFEFVKKKFRNIIVPYYFICIAICLISIPISLILHQNAEDNLIRWIIASLYGSGVTYADPFGIQGIGAIWFLWATFWGEILLRKLVDSKNKIFIVLGVVITFFICFFSTRFVWLPLSIQTTGNAVLYMYIGYQIRLNRQYIQKYSSTITRIIGFMLSFIGSVYFYHTFSSFWLVHNEIGHWYFIPLSLCACYVLVVVSRFVSKYSLILHQYFSFLGKYSLLMLGFHIIELDLFPWNNWFVSISPHIVTNPTLYPFILAFCKIFFISICMYGALHLSFIRTIFHYNEAPSTISFEYKWILKRVLYSLLFVVLAEGVVYNYHHWQSFSSKETMVESIKFGNGIKKIDDTSIQVKNEENAYIEIKNINQRLQNINMEIFEEGKSTGNVVKIQIQYRDDSSSTYNKLSPTEIVQGVSKSQIKYLRLNGKTKSLRIYLLNSKDKKYTINSLVLNKDIPYQMNIFRDLLLFGVAFIIQLFSRRSILYQCKLNWNQSFQRLMISVFIIVQIFGVSAAGYITRPDWMHTTWLASNQYDYLAESLVEGKVSLKFEPPKYLEKLANPYDCGARGKIESTSKEKSITDFAYYKGKYYSYFGVIPCLLFFVPYYLLTGHPLGTWIACVICADAFILVSYCFVFVLAKRRFQDISLGIYLLLSTVFVIASQIFYTVIRADVYVLPIIFSMFFIVLGTLYWLKAVNQEDKSINKKSLFLGSVCMASILGCRPQMSIAVLFAVPIFWDSLKKGYFFTKKYFSNFLTAATPFLFIWGGLLLYNKIRFDSFLDFGATYNLTGFDMTNRTLYPSRLLLGFFEYWIQPFVTLPYFPFMKASSTFMNLTSDFQGQIISEGILGGFFSLNIIALFGLFIKTFKKELKEKKLYSFGIIAILCAVIIFVVDTLVVGINQRYLSDFSVFWMIAVVLVLLAIHESCVKNKYYSTIISVTAVLSILCVVVNSLTIFAIDGRFNPVVSSPYIFYSIKYLLFIV